VEAPDRTPAASTRARSAPKPKVEHQPLQVRLPVDQVVAIKVAAAQRRQSISDFMLTCFHAFMKSGSHAE
jgi:hypothetical protein